MLINDLIDYLLLSLYELSDSPIENEFILGEAYAYIDCLEFVLQGTADDSELLELERKHGII